MRNCPHCNDELAQSGPFCGSCGRKVGETPATTEQTADEDSDDADHATRERTERVVPKQNAGIVGIAVGLSGSLGIMLGSLFPVTRSCPPGGSACSYTGGLLEDPVVAVPLFVVGLALFSIVADDYKHLGLLGSWEPRKTRLYGAFGSLLLVVLLVATPQNLNPGLGGLLLFVSATGLLGFAGVVGLWRIAFRKKAGAK